jgi:2-C-methyl-D-erythritol 4-phosphate cytidylyltransferase
MPTAIIVAAGKGVRMQSPTPKQFVAMGGRPILSHTIEALSACPAVHRLVLVVPEADFDFCRDHGLDRPQTGVPVDLVAGGARRQESVYNGLVALEDVPPDHVVLIHDGVRPFVPVSLVDACIRGARAWGACIPAVQATDTLKQTGPDQTIARTVDRESVRLAQTPQAFEYGLILSAHEAARRAGYCGTDDASLVERQGGTVRLVPGIRTNIKITTPEDLALAEAFIAANLVRCGPDG